MLGFTWPRLPWLWLVLLSLPAFVWALRREQRTLQSTIITLLDDLAKTWELRRLRPSIEVAKPAAPSPAPANVKDSPFAAKPPASPEMPVTRDTTYA